MAHFSADDTPSQALGKLVENAHSMSPDHLKAACFGFIHSNVPTDFGRWIPPRVNGPGDYDPWTKQHTLPHPQYRYCVPWDDDTGEILQWFTDFLDTPHFMRHECAWLLKAWLSWQGVPD